MSNVKISNTPVTNSETSSVGSVPLIVDLDGTLTKSNTMHEGLLSLISRHPSRILQIILWLAKGKAAFKDRLAKESVIDVATLPLRSEVLDQIAVARDAQRQILLVSASNHRQVEGAAKQTGLFDEAVGSTETRNLAGKEKAR